jgi:hypothetical protein
VERKAERAGRRIERIMSVGVGEGMFKRRKRERIMESKSSSVW